MTNDIIKSEPQTVEDEFVPGPPPGSPPAHLPQPTLKNPEKFMVNQMIYFHYNINDHSMYVSPCPFPTHGQTPSAQQPPQIPQAPQQHINSNVKKPYPCNIPANNSPVMQYPANQGSLNQIHHFPNQLSPGYRMRPPGGIPQQSQPPIMPQQSFSPQSYSPQSQNSVNRFPANIQTTISSPIQKSSFPLH